MYSILIVEDNAMQRISLKKMLSFLHVPLNVYEASNAIDAYNLSIRVSIDLFLVDIELEGSSGLDLATKLRNIPNYKFSWIIFLTTHIEFLTEAFTRIHCYDFILKPYNKNKVLDMIREIMEYDVNKDILQNKRKSVSFEIQNGIYIKVYIDEIIFIESSMRSVVVHTVKGEYGLKRITLKKVLSLIEVDNIIQSHKSFIVNLNYINKIVKIDSRLMEVYFENYDKTALVGNKFKDSILAKFEMRNI